MKSSVFLNLFFYAHHMGVNREFMMMNYHVLSAVSIVFSLFCYKLTLIFPFFFRFVANLFCPLQYIQETWKFRFPVQIEKPTQRVFT